MGTTMDGMKTYNFLESTKMGESKDTNNYQIQKLYNNTSARGILSKINRKPFGHEINITIGEKQTSIVGEQTEYLVDFNYFVNKLSNIGFNLVYKYDFDMFDAINNEEHFLQFLPKRKQLTYVPRKYMELVNMKQKTIPPEIFEFSKLNVGFQFIKIR